MGTLEVLNGSSCRRLELDDCLAVVHHLRINDDFQIQVFSFHHPLKSGQVNPDVVSVEDLEFADRLEIFQMFRRHLGNFQQAN